MQLIQEMERRKFGVSYCQRISAGLTHVTPPHNGQSSVWRVLQREWGQGVGSSRAQICWRVPGLEEIMARRGVPLSCRLLFYTRGLLFPDISTWGRCSNGSAVLHLQRERVCPVVLLYSICNASECASSSRSGVIRKLLDPVLNIFPASLRRWAIQTYIHGYSLP
jgi:hypothetical protein